VIETLYADKKRLEKDLKIYKDRHQQNTTKISTLNDSAKLHSELQFQLEIIKGKDENISSLEGEIMLRDERIAMLEYELNVAHRAINVQNKFEETPGIVASVGGNRELLRRLYFAVGKSQADSNSMGQALADMQHELDLSNKKLEEYEKRMKELEENKKDLENKVESESSLARACREELERISEQWVAKEFTIQHLEDDKKHLQQDNLLLKRSYDDLINNKNLELQALKEQLQQSQHKLHQQEQRNKGLEQAIDQLHYSLEQSNENNEKEKKRLQQQLSDTESKLSSYLKCEEECVTLRKEVSDLQLSLSDCRHNLQFSKAETDYTQQTVNALNYQLANEKKHVEQLEIELEGWKSSVALTSKERDEVAYALKQSMAITRELMNRLQMERTHIKELEKQLTEEITIRKKISLMMLDTTSVAPSSSSSRSMHRDTSPPPPPPPTSSNIYPSENRYRYGNTTMSTEDFSWLHNPEMVKAVLEHTQQISARPLENHQPQSSQEPRTSISSNISNVDPFIQQ
jgi:chromosome segregation ATPase